MRTLRCLALVLGLLACHSCASGSRHIRRDLVTVPMTGDAALDKGIVAVCEWETHWIQSRDDLCKEMAPANDERVEQLNTCVASVVEKYNRFSKAEDGSACVRAISAVARCVAQGMKCNPGSQGQEGTTQERLCPAEVEEFGRSCRERE